MEMQGLPDVSDYMEKLAPHLQKVSLPVNAQGEVPPQVLAQMVAQGIVAQRFMQIQMDLEIHKLTTMFKFLAANPWPVTVDESFMKTWGQDLCKCLHEHLTNYSEHILQMMQETAKQQQSKIIMPNGQKPGLVR